jgi:GTP-binding protein EngB required for normal cell division
MVYHRTFAPEHEAPEEDVGGAGDVDVFDAATVSYVTDPVVASSYDSLLKIVVLGDSAVGKSALLRR